MEPSTWPQMPATGRLAPAAPPGVCRPLSASGGATSMSQVEVPMIFIMVARVIPPPTAPTCASKQPTATGIPSASPSRPAHSALRAARPAGRR